MADNEFRSSEVPPGSALLVGGVGVFNVDELSLSEGKLDGSNRDNQSFFSLSGLKEFRHRPGVIGLYSDKS